MYEKLSKDLKEADEIIQAAIIAGKYLYILTGCAITGLYYVIDHRVNIKVEEVCKDLDDKVDAQSKYHEEFKRVAVRDFQDHVSKTQLGLTNVQADVNNLRQKVLDNQEEERDHRHQVHEAAKSLKLNGYIVVSSEELVCLLEKINEIDQRTASLITANQGPLNGEEMSDAKIVAVVSQTDPELQGKLVTGVPKTDATGPLNGEEAPNAKMVPGVPQTDYADSKGKLVPGVPKTDATVDSQGRKVES